MHDAMIASSGTGTAGPSMGTMHGPQAKGEMINERTRQCKDNRLKQKYRIHNNAKSDSGTKEMQHGRSKRKETEFVTTMASVPLLVPESRVK